MPSEIRQLLQRIEDEQLAARRGLSDVAITARHDFINVRYHNIDQAHQRLLQLCGPQATGFVYTMIENADLLYDAQQARERMRMREEEK